MGQGKDLLRLLDDFTEFTSLLQVVGHGLVANYVETGFEKSLGYFEMQIVLHHDGDEVDALSFGQGGFLLGHFLVTPVAPLRVEVKILAR